jgi:hypothetical protein
MQHTFNNQEILECIPVTFPTLLSTKCLIASKVKFSSLLAFHASRAANSSLLVMAVALPAMIDDTRAVITVGA